jgi:predicted transcriptional regulator
MLRPSIMVLERIVDILEDRNAVGRTALSLETRINYKRVRWHLQWLEERGLIELVIQNGQIMVRLTSRGREFAALIKLTGASVKCVIM